MSNLKDYKCIQIIKNRGNSCEEKECRHWMACDKSHNCSVIASEDGPKTLQEIGNYYGISRMRVCQIEKSLLEKLKSSKLLSEFDPSSS